MSKKSFNHGVKPQPDLTKSELLLVECLQDHFEPAELAAIFAHIQGATETKGPERMRRYIVAAFGDNYLLLNESMDEAGV